MLKFFFKTFFLIITNVIGHFQILKRVRHNKPNNTKYVWYNHELANMKDRLIYFHKMAKNNSNLWQTFLGLKRDYRQALSSAKLQYNENYINQIKNKCKAAWKVINGNKPSSTVKCSQIDISPDVFNNYFIDSVSEIKRNLGNPPCSSQEWLEKSPKQPPESFQWVDVTSNDILKAAKDLNSSDSIDIYGMSNNTLKKLFLT